MPKSSTVAGVLLQDRAGRYLLVQERRADVFGLWNLPAGHAEPGETPKNAAIREAFEEVGLKVEIPSSEPFYTAKDPVKNHIYIAFQATISGGRLEVFETELLDAKWLLPGEIERLHEEGKIRGAWTIESIRKSEQHANTRH